MNSFHVDELQDYINKFTSLNDKYTEIDALETFIKGSRIEVMNINEQILIALSMLKELKND